MRDSGDHRFDINSAAAHQPAAPSDWDPAAEPGIVVVTIEAQPEASDSVARTLTQIGYLATGYRRVAEAAAAVCAAPPAVLIFDRDAAGPHHHAELAALRALQTALPTPVPVLFVSQRGDFDTLLETVRHHGIHRVKPLDIPQLIDYLERMIPPRDPDPYRILVIDDDPTLLGHFARILAAAGMRVETLSAPQQTLHALEQFRPELILLDIHLPECSGLELARVIRLCDDWVGIPIIHLSPDCTPAQRIAALESGGNEFLTMPIADDYLIATVRASAARARRLNELLARDSLTGLLKHAVIKEEARAALWQARRTGQALCLAMFDLDHFKAVNDTYGHALGDRVIRALAQLLTRRLRRSDRVGRYGGEEFMAVLHGCDAVSARIVLEEIRAAFAAIPFLAGEREFFVTVSIGFALADGRCDAEALMAAADRAVYEAKRAGRNRVCQAEPRCGH